ncbi:hypothetical protein Tco_0126841 [Tanacetum coccineum]
MVEALSALDITPKQVSQEEKQSVSYYVKPYEPPIPFPRRLEHHAEEALIQETMESLKKIKINHPLLKEIRQMENYVKHMKNLVANKPMTQKDKETRMNPRLDFNNALADLGASISIMPLSMYKCLGMGKLEPINKLLVLRTVFLCLTNKTMYNSWQSRTLLYIKGKKNGRMMLESINNGLLVYPTVEENSVIRPKKYAKLTKQEQLQDDYDVQETNIVLQGLSPDVYALVNHYQTAKDIWERVKLPMQGTELSYQERECKLYNEFDKFTSVKGESLREYYL